MGAGRIAILPLALLLGAAEGARESWPGLPPDCWPESRRVHGRQPWRDLDAHLRITRAAVSSPADRLHSPNGGYWAAWESARPNSSMIVYAEKDHQLEFVFLDVDGIEEPLWVNEKLLFLRVWWGQIAATDLIYDVERERFVYDEALVDGRQAMEQFRAACAERPGCRCIRPAG